MNFTRWSARLPGTQRRAAARTEPRSSPTGRPRRRRRARGPRRTAHRRARRPYRPSTNSPSARSSTASPPWSRSSTAPTTASPTSTTPTSTAFGVRPAGEPAREALPELDELGLLPLLDQVLRSGKPRTVKSRKAPDGRSYTFTCTPVDRGRRGGGVLVFATDVTDHAEAAERLRASERRQRETAVTLQRSLLPQELEEPDDLRIAATYQPGGTEAAVGGDWYDVITLGGGRTALVIGDVMGRGVRAAAVMGQLRTAVRAYARLDLPPHEVLQLLDGLAAEIDANQIATCVYAIHDPNEGRLVYASAGHLPILVRDESGMVLRADEPTGPPLGTGGWMHASGSIPLGPGSTAVLYTDGLVERRDEDLDEGIASLERALSGATGTPQVVCDRLVRSAGVTADHDDDVAVLVLQHPARTGPDSDLFRNAALELLGGVEAAPRARAFASGVLTSWRFPAELHDLGVLAASELVANSLQHGTPPMRLRLRRTDRRLIVEVTDGDDHLPAVAAPNRRRVRPRHRHRGDDRLELGLPPDTGRRKGGVVRVRPAGAPTRAARPPRPAGLAEAARPGLRGCAARGDHPALRQAEPG